AAARRPGGREAPARPRLDEPHDAGDPARAAHASRVDRADRRGTGCLRRAAGRARRRGARGGRLGRARRRQQRLAAGGRGARGDGINAWLRVADERAATLQLAAVGIRVAAGTPFQLGDGADPYVRVTVGALREEVEAVGAALAVAQTA